MKKSVFEKDIVYYRGNTIYKGGCDTSSYLGVLNAIGDDAIHIEKIANEIRNFVNDADANVYEIVRHEAKAGDNLAHETGVVLHLERQNNQIIIK